MEQQIVVSPAGSIDSHGWKKIGASCLKYLAGALIAWLIQNISQLPLGNLAWLTPLIIAVLTWAQQYFMPQTTVINQN